MPIANNRDTRFVKKGIQTFHKVLYRTATNIGHLTVLYQRFLLILESEIDVVGKVKVSKVLVSSAMSYPFATVKRHTSFLKTHPITKNIKMIFCVEYKYERLLY